MENAYTESINRLAKNSSRMGRGYALEVVRAKMLYDTNALENGTMTRRVAVPMPKDEFGGLGFGKMGYTGPERPTTNQRCATGPSSYTWARISRRFARSSSQGRLNESPAS